MEFVRLFSLTFDLNTQAHHFHSLYIHRKISLARLAQEREYSKLIDTANAPIFGVDTDGRVNVWNQCARKLVGYTMDEVIGKNLVQEFITKEYKSAVKSVLDKAMRGKETANFEFPLITKNGIRIEVLLNATTRRDEQGNVIGVVGIGQDITGRIAQEREYSKLIDTANAPIFGVDTQGCVNVWNQCAMRLVGYNTHEVMGHSLVKEFSKYKQKCISFDFYLRYSFDANIFTSFYHHSQLPTISRRPSKPSSTEL